jgi:hypothetical protein
MRTMSAKTCVGVALGAGHVVALPEPRHPQRVDRIDLVPGRDERQHPGATVSLDPDDDIRVVVIAKVFADHRVQPGDTRDAYRQLGPSQHPTRLVLQFDVVIVLRPVVSDEQQRSTPIHSGHYDRSLREIYQRPNKQVLTPGSAGTTSHQRSHLPTTGRGTV